MEVCNFMRHISFDLDRPIHAIAKGLKAKAAPNQPDIGKQVHRKKFRASV
jgi:hypothetical protein